jgi:hypothetical protein
VRLEPQAVQAEFPAAALKVPAAHCSKTPVAGFNDHPPEATQSLRVEDPGASVVEPVGHGVHSVAFPAAGWYVPTGHCARIPEEVLSSPSTAPPLETNQPGAATQELELVAPLMSVVSPIPQGEQDELLLTVLLKVPIGQGSTLASFVTK